MNNDEMQYDSKNIYLRNGENIIGLHEVGFYEDWTAEGIKNLWHCEERWGNEYNNDKDLKMIGRGSFRVFQDIEEVAQELIQDGWTRFIPDVKV